MFFIGGRSHHRRQVDLENLKSANCEVVNCENAVTVISFFLKAGRYRSTSLRTRDRRVQTLSESWQGGARGALAQIDTNNQVVETRWRTINTVTKDTLPSC